jgi:hypothetical protein
MEEKFKTLATEEILGFKQGDISELAPESNNLGWLNLLTFQLILLLKRKLNLSASVQDLMFNKGMPCEALTFGAKGWQKGKVRVKITVEFCPDEPEVEEISENNQLEISPPESPLDDLRRQLLNHENQPNNS